MSSVDYWMRIDLLRAAEDSMKQTKVNPMQSLTRSINSGWKMLHAILVSRTAN
jgi:hypothetical protein